MMAVVLAHVLRRTGAVVEVMRVAEVAALSVVAAVVVTMEVEVEVSTDRATGDTPSEAVTMEVVVAGASVSAPPLLLHGAVAQ